MTDKTFEAVIEALKYAVQVIEDERLEPYGDQVEVWEKHKKTLADANAMILNPALINPDSDFECIFCHGRFQVGDGHICGDPNFTKRRLRLSSAITLLILNGIIVLDDGDSSSYFFMNKEFNNPVEALDFYHKDKLP